MAGLATAGRPCQPTNPPPKRYKPPKLTQAKQNGNEQRHYIDPKIIDPCCGASTHSYVATYSHNSTDTKKPTMTPPTNDQHPTPSKNNKKYATKKVFKPFNHKDDSTKASPTSYAANLLMENGTQEIPQTSQQRTESPSPTPDNNPTPPKIESNSQIPGKHTTDPRPFRLSPAKHLQHIIDTNPTTQNQASRTSTNYQTHLQQSHLLPTLVNPTPPRTLINRKQKLTEPVLLDQWITTDALTIHPLQQAPRHHPPLTPLHSPLQDNSAKPHYDKATPNLPPQVKSALPPSWIPENCITETNTLMQELKKQLAITHTLIDRLSMTIMPSSIITSPRTTQQTLFDLIAKLHPNDPLKLQVSTPPFRITKNHRFNVKPTNHRYQFSPKLLRYVKTSTGTTQYHLSTNLLWSILSFTFPHSKDLQKVP